MMNTIKKEKEEAKQRKELAAFKCGENLSVKQKKKNRFYPTASHLQIKNGAARVDRILMRVLSIREKFLCIS